MASEYYIISIFYYRLISRGFQLPTDQHLPVRPPSPDRKTRKGSPSQWSSTNLAMITLSPGIAYIFDTCLAILHHL